RGGDWVRRRVFMPLDREEVVLAGDGERDMRTDRVLRLPQQLTGLGDDLLRQRRAGRTIPRRERPALPGGQGRARRERRFRRRWSRRRRGRSLGGGPREEGQRPAGRQGVWPPRPGRVGPPSGGPRGPGPPRGGGEPCGP